MCYKQFLLQITNLYLCPIIRLDVQLIILDFPKKCHLSYEIKHLETLQNEK